LSKKGLLGSVSGVPGVERVTSQPATKPGAPTGGGVVVEADGAVGVADPHAPATETAEATSVANAKFADRGMGRSLIERTEIPF
jgi:hypothetical protein